MKKTLLIVVLLVVISILPASAQEQQTWKITLTNLTVGQSFTSPVVVVHSDGYSLFTPGKRASRGLQFLAEDGATGMLSNMARSHGSVSSVQTAGSFGPGKSTSFEVTVTADSPLLSLVGMLASTNDAFYAVRNLELTGQRVTWYGQAWDAGSEENNESEDYVPGLGAHNERQKKGSERFVHIHPGIHGIAELEPDRYDWRNPVLLLEAVRVQ